MIDTDAINDWLDGAVKDIGDWTEGAV